MKGSHVTSMSVFRNLDCLALVNCGKTTLLKLQTALFLFSPNHVLPKRGCGLSMDVAYTQAFMVIIKSVLHSVAESSFIYNNDNGVELM